MDVEDEALAGYRTLHLLRRDTRALLDLVQDHVEVGDGAAHAAHRHGNQIGALAAVVPSGYLSPIVLEMIDRGPPSTGHRSLDRLARVSYFQDLRRHLLVAVAAATQDLYGPRAMPAPVPFIIDERGRPRAQQPVEPEPAPD
jgi:hypothetical protein